MDDRRMTKYEMEEIACPKCGKKHRVKKYSLINALEKPEIKKDILQNKVFYFQCDDCNLTAPLTYSSVYMDSKKKLMVVLESAPGEADMMLENWRGVQGYRKRRVDNINDLKEKIMIAENHLDDRVIELVKIEYIRQLEKEMKDDTLMNILFDYHNNDFCFVVFFEKKGIGKIPMSLDYYRQIERQYVKQLGTHSTDDFIKIDMEWAGNVVLGSR